MPTLTVTLNQALKENEILEIIRYTKDEVGALIEEGRLTNTQLKQGTNNTYTVTETGLPETAGTEYTYKARVYNKTSKAELAQKVSTINLDTVAEPVIVTNYDAKTKTLSGYSKEIGATIFVNKETDGVYKGGAQAVVQLDGKWSMQLKDDVPIDNTSISGTYWKATGRKDTPIAISMVDKAGNQPKSSIISDLYVFNTKETADGGYDGGLTPPDTPVDSKGTEIPSAVNNKKDSDFDGNGKNYGISWDKAQVKNQTIYANEITTYSTQAVHAFDIGTGEGDDVLYVEKKVTSNIRIKMGEGNDTLYTGKDFGDGHGKVDTRLDMEAGDDIVEIKGNSSLTKIDLGVGNDRLKIEGVIHNVQISAGDGNDLVHIAGHGNAIKGGSNIDMGAGNDTLVVGYNIESNSNIKLGAGNDVFHYGFHTVEGKIDGGEGFDVFRVFNTASRDVTIRHDDITNFERVDITGEKNFTNTFVASGKLFEHGNYRTNETNPTLKELLLDGDKNNSILRFDDASQWKKQEIFVDAKGVTVIKKDDGSFETVDKRIIKGKEVADSNNASTDTKYYYTDNGVETSESYEGNIYQVYTTTNDEHQRLLVDLDITII